MASENLETQYVDSPKLSVQDNCLRDVGFNGCTSMDKRGNTLLQQYLLRTRLEEQCPLAVYCYCHLKVPVNSQNQKSGDTALHIAARSGRWDLVEALLLCGADPHIRNKYALMPSEEIKPDDKDTRKILEFYNGGLAYYLKNLQAALWRNLPGTWFALNTYIDENSTGYDIGSRACSGIDLEKRRCLELLNEAKPHLDFVHCVLTDDVAGARKLLDRYGKYLNVNARCTIPAGNVRYARSLLSVAIQNNSLQLVSLLLQHGASATMLAKPTILSRPLPTFHGALAQGFDFAIFKELTMFLSFDDRFIKNHRGNTMLLEAIECGRSTEEIQFILEQITRSRGLSTRRSDGKNIKEVAILHGRTDILPLIDNVIREIMQGLKDEENRKRMVQIAASSLNQEFFRINGEDDSFKILMQLVDSIEIHRNALFEAVSKGNLDAVKKHHLTLFKNKNGYTALIKAIAHGELRIAEWLLAERPVLRAIPDNGNRYPLHFAYALAAENEERSARFVKLLIEEEARKPEVAKIRIEEVYDLDGQVPLDFKREKGDREMRILLEDVRACHECMKQQGGESSPADGAQEQGMVSPYLSGEVQDATSSRSGDPQDVINQLMLVTMSAKRHPGDNLQLAEAFATPAATGREDQ